MSTFAENPYKAPQTTAEFARQNILVLWVMRFLALLATAVSGYLVWVAFSGGKAVGCGGAMDCDEVLRSAWSKWFGLPVSIPALSMYGTLLFVLLLAGPIAPERVRKLCWTIATCLSALAAAAAVYFVSLQMFVVKEYCTWCFTVHVAGLGLFLMALVAGSIRWPRKLIAMGAGVLGLAVLFAGQYGQEVTPAGLFAEKTTGVQTGPIVRLDPTKSPSDDTRPATGSISMSDLEFFRVGPPTANDTPTTEPTTDVDIPIAPPVTATNLSPEDVNTGQERLLTVLGGSAELNAYQYPIMGSYEADHLIVKLFDYTCPHCRTMHRHLVAAHQAFGDQVGVLMIPVPLSSDCNPYVTRTSPKAEDACQLAALALAVWRIDASQFEPFHDWLMTGDHPPSAADAKVKAEGLVGARQLSAQLSDVRLSQRLAVGAQLYKLARLGSIPKLLLPHAMITGSAVSQEELFEVLSRHLKIEPR